MTDGPLEAEWSSVWQRLCRRKVVQWGIAPGAGAWGLLQDLAYLSTLLAGCARRSARMFESCSAQASRWSSTFRRTRSKRGRGCAACSRAQVPAMPDETCKARLRQRNSSGTHEYQVSDADFDLFTSYFVPPSDTEGFNVVRHASPAAAAPEE